MNKKTTFGIQMNPFINVMFSPSPMEIYEKQVSRFHCEMRGDVLSDLVKIQ